MQGIGAEEVQEQLAAGQDSGDDEVHQAETEPGGAQDGEQQQPTADGIAEDVGEINKQEMLIVSYYYASSLFSAIFTT